MKKKGEGNFSLSLRNNIFDSKTPTDKLPVPSFFDNAYNQEIFNTVAYNRFFYLLCDCFDVVSELRFKNNPFRSMKVSMCL
jgi:hypothetical protein